MKRFSANISMLFAERPLLDRFQAARDAGFTGVEIQFPYDTPIDTLVAAKERAGVGISVINLPVGDMLSGGPGIAAMPGREKEFEAATRQALSYAAALKPRNVNVLSGWPPAELPRERCLATLAGNLKHAAAAMAEIGVRLVVEAVNRRDRPGFFLGSSAEAIEAMDRAGHPNIGLEYDLYHMQIAEGDLVPTMRRLIARIGHIQFADTPGRHEPGTGEINFPFVFDAIEAAGYDGWLAAEYVPSTKRTEDCLGWLKPYRA
ncbi:MAG: hydroxypyruvate isomerase family protein [Candidatus Eiseniibacteriota bacterium]